jgi:type III pantothenate kinase
MILAIDVGNTNTVLGLMPHNGGAPAASWRLSSHRERTADEWRGLLDPILGPYISDGAVHGATIGSVVPAVTGPLVTLCEQWLGLTPLIVSSALDLGITLGQKQPQEVGADRIANAVAAFDQVRGACLVIDLGTATKIEAIDAGGCFRGGIIAPGLGVSRDALALRAARLFAVDLTAPETAIGRDTMSAVQSGVVLGHARMVEGLVADVLKELESDATIFLTGGHAAAIQTTLRLNAEFEPELTLLGLRLLYQRNVRG